MWANRARYFAAVLALVTAVGYFLIAAHVLPVVEPMDRGITVFGLIAGAGFCAISAALLFWKRRFVWIVVTLLQIFAIAMYFKVGPDRTPRYEIWGILLRIPQFLILCASAYLSFSRAATGAARDTAGPKNAAED